ncbi:sodium channel protein Nach-like [Eupeodes corollae]|uniref:sodium channel protein Nach-like n=1 Tax=Eupeodes corollae TaxID=290404 RepID=UPI0024916462|nr:sodium channel protein Nach-like [Eupeodes corollae]
MIYLANKLATSFHKGFIANPVRMIIETDHAVSAKILFPSVTVCPGTLFNHSKAVNLIQTFKLPNGTTEDIVMKNLYQIYAFTYPKFKTSNDRLSVLSEVMNLNNYTLIKFLADTQWDCGAFFFRCRFQSKTANCSDIFRINKSHVGFCCSFNSQQSKDNIHRFKSNRHGLRQGLSLIFNDVDFDNTHLLSSNPQRFRLLIHRPTAYPDQSTFRKFLHRNEEILLRFDPTETTYSDEVWKRLTMDERNCTLLSETHLYSFKNYNRQNCIAECLSSIILKTCKCVPFNLFPPPNSLVCNFGDVSCVSNNYKLFKRLKDDCKCLDHCKKIEYAIRLTSGKLETTVDVADPFYDGFHENFTVVHVFLQSQEYRRIRRDIVWNIVSLAGNLGNCYSVFVGISALSIFELIYFSVFVLRRNYKNNTDLEN